MDQCSVIDFVNVVLVLEYSRHLRQWSFPEDDPSETDTREANQDRNQGKPTLGADLFTRMRGVRHLRFRHNRSFVRTFSGNSSRLTMRYRRQHSHGRFKRVLEHVDVLMREYRAHRIGHTDKTTDRR